MKVLFVNQFYYPDVAATAQQMSDLAEHLVENGHDAHVLCSRGQYDDGSGQPTPRKETYRGVWIRRLSAPGFGKKSTIGRIIDYAGFHLLAGLWLILFGWRYQVIVTLTTPPLIGVYATMVKFLTFGRTKHVCWAMDLHPDCEFELGLCSRKNPFWRFLDFLNGMHFRRANATVALGDCMKKRLLDKRVKQEKLHVIGVWNRKDQVTPMGHGESPLRKEIGLEDKFIVMYSGNAGLIHTFDAVCAAMKKLRDDTNIHFVFVGGGKRLAEIKQFATENGLTNFTQLPYFPREQLSESLAMGDAHLVTMRKGMQGVAVPCKLYGIMAAARPAIFVGPTDADTAIQINQANCGKVIDIDDDNLLVDTIRSYANDLSQVSALGQSGYEYFLKYHEQQICCDAWESLLTQVTQRK